MRPHTEAFLDVLATPAALLRGIARRDSNHLMAGSLSLVAQDVKKRAPTGVVNTLGEMVIAHHPYHVQVLYAEAAVPLSIPLGGLEVEVAALATDLQVLAGDFAAGFATAMAALRAAADGALPVRQALLPPTIVSGILHRLALGVGQKHFQAHVQPNRGMIAIRLSGMCFSESILGQRLTDDQRVPMSISPQHEMRRDGRPFKRAVQLDFEQAPQLGGHMQMRTSFIEPYVAVRFILAELNRVPAVGRLEAREAHRHSQLLEVQGAFERLGKPVGQRLHRCGGHRLAATSLEARREVILRGKRAVRVILRSQTRQHLIIDRSRFREAVHQLLSLCAVGVQSVLKRSHALLVLHRACAQQDGGTYVARAGERLLPPCLKAGALSRILW